MSKQTTKILLTILVLSLMVIGITYMFLFSRKPKLTTIGQGLEQAGWPVGDMINKMVKDAFPIQKFFLIDNSLIFVQRSGFVSDYGFHHVLLDKNQKELCSYADSFAGAKMQCNDASKEDIFETIIKNSDKENLGLNDHKVELIYSTKIN